MANTDQLDYFDRQILAQLETDGRKAFSAIAKDLNISNTMVHQRVARLKALGVYANIGLQLDERALGFQWSAFTGVILSKDSDSKDVIEKLKQIPEITECYYITGQYTLFIRIVARSSEHMRQVLYDKIDGIDEVLKTETFIDFGVAFKRNVPIGLAKVSP